MRCLLPAALVSVSSVLTAGAEGLSFNRDIRPILSDKCFACHGMDAKKREAKLRLDVPDGAFAKDKDGKSAIVPGKPEESEAWRRIITTDENDVMPPPESKKNLTPQEKETLRKWIEQGAPYQKHWAFEPIAKPMVPDGGAGEIDRFLSARLKKDGLALSPEADRETLVRRVSITLTGLPPAVAEADMFVNDKSDGAYERMVDRYLASPYYGEEMARHWLDVARYADTHGMHLDNERQMWAYRDWVVNAFNRNLGFDAFTIDQLAGDLVPNATQAQIVATGFNRCNVTSGEGGSIDAEYRYRYAVDRASTTAQAWLGLTAGCAVCHDHKYDPISTKEFYSLYAFFNSSADPAMDGNALLTQPVAKVKPAGYDAKIKTFDDRLVALKKQMEEKAAVLAYQDPAEQNPKPVGTRTEQVWFEDSFPAGAQVVASGHGTTLVDKPVASGKKALKRGGPEMAQDSYASGAAPFEVPQNGKLFVSVYLDPSDPPEEVMLQFNDGDWEHRAIWGSDLIAWGAENSVSRYKAGVLPPAGQWTQLEVEAAKVGLTTGMKVKGYAFTVHGGTAYFDKLGISGDTNPATDPALSFAAWRAAQKGKDVKEIPRDLRGWLKEGPDKPRTPEEVKRLRDYYVQNVCVSTQPQFKDLNDALAAAKKQRDDYDASVPSTFVWRDMPAPRDSFVMMRGQYDKPGEKVEPGTLAVLPPMKHEGRATRLDLAKWLVASENPLTPRVTVNRFWQQVFGAGLVTTSDDFGTQGALPSHPELLDWLAVWFQENKWDVKKLMRLMLTSAAFRQQSGAAPENWQHDPSNVWLSRGPRFRLDAEQLRDQALFVSGLINLEMGGRGVNTYQPPNIWEPVGFAGSNTRFYKQDTGPALYRRSLYVFYKRTAPAPFMANFDAPNREQSCTRRERSNTPLQALQLMNDVQHFEAARVFASRIIGGASSPPERVTFAFRTALSRRPSAPETAAVLEFYNKSLAKYKATPAEAKKAISFGETKPPSGIDEAELAAWALVANLILNMDEAIVRN
ncbi:MAG TPA: PSD1 and planctomycete cytochrome C domain-containing protein [Verrucomicrobiales bacterium]|nr:PSD1 and planctomycete cytochrome C domain-containing protein [Verrucomicrobiales bacterium]